MVTIEVFLIVGVEVATADVAITVVATTVDVTFGSAVGVVVATVLLSTGMPLSSCLKIKKMTADMRINMMINAAAKQIIKILLPVFAAVGFSTVAELTGITFGEGCGSI
jgi:hypothetical protein